MNNTPSSPRLNVQALPTNTDRRFVLLIFAILSTNLYIFHSLLVSQFLGLTQSWSVTNTLNSEYTSCIKQSISTSFLSSDNISGLSYHCSWQADGLLLLFLLAGAVLMLAIAFLIYWLLPTLKCRRQHLVPLRENENEIAAVINSLELLRQTFPFSIPHIHFMRDIGSNGSPMVFAGLGRRYLVLTDESLLLSGTNPDEFRAIMLHEFAHFQNKDANKLYFAIAISCSFILTSLLPFLIILVWSLFSLSLSGHFVANIGFVLSEAFGIFSLAGLIFFVYQSILRSRETFADILSSAWVVSPTFLLQAIQKLAPEKKPWWRTILIFHPNAQQRQRDIENPSRTFHLKFWEAFAIGITFGAALPSLSDIFKSVTRLLFGLGLQIPYSVTWPDPGTLILCLFVVFIIGQMIWRAILITRLEDNQPFRGAGRIGLGVAAGIILSTIFSVYFAPFVVFYQVHSWLLIISYCILLSLLLTFGMAGFCRWLALVGSLWLEIINTKRQFRWISFGNFLIAGVILALGFALFSLLAQATLGSLLINQSAANILNSPTPLQTSSSISFILFIIVAFFGKIFQRYYIFFALASLVALPSLPWFWYYKNISRPRFQWARIDEVTPTPLRNPFRLRPVGFIALLGGLLFCGGFLSIRLLLFPLILASPANILLFLFGSFVLAVFAQIMVAVVIFIRTRPVGMVNALLGAFLSGCIMVGGSLGIYRLFSPLGSDAFRFILLYEMNWGLICVTAVLLLIGVLSTRRKWPWFFLIAYLFLFITAAILPDLALSASNQHVTSPTTNIIQNGNFEQPSIVSAIIFTKSNTG